MGRLDIKQITAKAGGTAFQDPPAGELAIHRATDGYWRERTSTGRDYPMGHPPWVIAADGSTLALGVWYRAPAPRAFTLPASPEDGDRVAVFNQDVTSSSNVLTINAQSALEPIKDPETGADQTQALIAAGRLVELFWDADAAAGVPAPGWRVVDWTTGISDWVRSTPGMTAEAGDRIVIQDGHTINLPAAPADLAEVLFLPGNTPPDWSTLTGSFSPDAAHTIGAGQVNVPGDSEVVRLVYDLANTNWVVAL